MVAHAHLPNPFHETSNMLRTPGFPQQMAYPENDTRAALVGFVRRAQSKITSAMCFGNIVNALICPVSPQLTGKGVL
jgi:hypothetical protein